RLHAVFPIACFFRAGLQNLPLERGLVPWLERRRLRFQQLGKFLVRVGVGVAAGVFDGGAVSLDFADVGPITRRGGEGEHQGVGAKVHGDPHTFGKRSRLPGLATRSRRGLAIWMSSDVSVIDANARLRSAPLGTNTSNK